MLFFIFQGIEIGQYAIGIDHIGIIPHIVIEGHNIPRETQLDFQLLEVLHLGQNQVQI